MPGGYSEGVVDDPNQAPAPAVAPTGVPDADGMVEVIMPSGAPFPVHSEEVDYIVDRASRYLSENHFTNISDIQDVDRMLIMELICFRWGTWISRQKDYWGDAVDMDQLQQSLKSHSTELRQLKKQLGIDKLARDRAKGEDSVPAYLNNLLRRAKEFGVNRQKQLGKALELFQELQALVTLHDNCDEIERQENHVQTEDIMTWLKEVAFPEFNAIDEYFRTHQQQTWIRTI